jgi:TldD protein
MNATSLALPMAESILLHPYGLDQIQLDQVFTSLLAHQIDYADLYFQYSRAEGWSLDEGIVKSGSFHIRQGVGVRAVSQDKTAFAYSDDISLPALLEAAKATRAIGANNGRLSIATRQSIQIPTLYPGVDPIASLDAAQKVALLEKIERYARSKDTRISQVMANLSGEYEVVLVARHDGRLAADIRPLVRFGITVIVEQNGKREQGSSGGGGRTDYAYFTDTLLQQYADEAIDQALFNLEAKAAPAGEMTIVLGSGWPGVLLHEAIGHGLEGDFNRKGSSAFSGRLGEQVAAKGITIVDDGTLMGRRGSLNIDDEGNPTQNTALIEDGILTGYMQDSMNARLMNMPVTGNGRRESYAHIPMPRMTNTYMLNGDKHPDEIIASVKKGLYAKNFGGGQVDITNGKFVFSASEAWIIENGKLSYPVKGATLIGDGPEVLKYVSQIGNDMALDAGVGVCGKDGQSVPVGVGQPTLRIDGGLTVGGTV